MRLNKGEGVWFRREREHGKAEKGMGDSLQAHRGRIWRGIGGGVCQHWVGCCLGGDRAVER